MISYLRILILFLLTNCLYSCGKGLNQLGHQGLCDGYVAWNTSDYVLPYPIGESYLVSQGNCSSISHINYQRYAYDIVMEVGTAISAVRAGIVLDLKEDEIDGNGCPEANYVRILHGDDTVANYYHLTTNGALVSVGDNILQGDAIALSGNTGCSTAAHLHFMVTKTRYSYDTVPVTFQNTNSNPRGLKAGSKHLAK